eukprot:10443288-Heterocapsa_arctica.AAC.1
MSWISSMMPRPIAEIDSLFRALDWKLTGAGRFSRTSHINIQEARALKTYIRRVSAWTSSAQVRLDGRQSGRRSARVLSTASTRGWSAAVFERVARPATG